MDKKVYIVPHDFTTAANTATQHALRLARQTGAQVILLHITKTDKDKRKAEQNFQKVMTELALSDKDPAVNYRIVTGSIFEDIGKLAQALEASLIVMGTHGAKGMQKVFGSYALKVITSSSIPFLIVQEASPVLEVEKIVLPVDLAKESMQVMDSAIEVARIFDATILVVGEKESDPLLAKKIATHITVVRKHLAKNGVPSHVQLLEGSGSLHSKVTEYAKQQSAEMFAIAYHSESLLPQFDRFAQSLMTNEEAKPSLIINSHEVSTFYF